MKKTVQIRTNTTVRRVGTGAYQIRTTVSNGSKTRTTVKTIRAR